MEQKQRKQQIDEVFINKNLTRYAILYFVICTAIILIKIIVEIILVHDPSILVITKIIGENIELVIFKWVPFIALPLAIIIFLVCLAKNTKAYKALEKIGWLNKAITKVAVTIDLLVSKTLKRKETYEQRKLEKQQEGIGQNKKPRDLSLDVLRGFFIISMIVGHYWIGDSLIKIIYSCHMAAFVVVSGYFFSKEKSLKDTLKSSAKTLLIPYAAFAVVQILINIPNWSGQFFLEALKKYLSGVILTKDILTNVESIGPAWFILMLFVVRILYTLIQKICKKEWIVTIVVVVLSIGGVVIGKAGYWLPWSFDIALYSLVFYHAGHLFKKFKVLEYVKEHLVLYFVLTPIWAHMIYKGSVELSRRNYNLYALGIIGALAGILTTYMLCTLLVDGCPAISNFLALLGKASMYILLVHTLLDEILRVALIKILPQGNIIIMIIAMAAELIASLIIFKLKTKCDKI